MASSTNQNEIEPQKGDLIEWKEEQERLVNMIGDFEQKLSHTSLRLLTLENDLKARTDERDGLKARVVELEAQLGESRKSQLKSASENQAVDEIKQKSEEMLTKAKSIIFEKTKVCKNQELQIEALHQQVESLREVVRITKDLLEIRNVEVTHLQDKLSSMESKIGTESERNKLIHSKLEKMVSMNVELKREYETQLCLFTALRERYNERELARNVLDDLKNDNKQAGTSNNTQSNNNEELGAQELSKEAVQVENVEENKEETDCNEKETVRNGKN
nr:putative uncharacterized protein MYH16 [Onthophagus taurus]